MGKKEVVGNATIVACGVMVEIEAFNSDFLIILSYLKKEIIIKPHLYGIKYRLISF